MQPGSRGYLDASLNVRILEIPTGQITRAMGDVHPQGNPHYWLDPNNGRLIAQAIRNKLTELQPADKTYFDQRYADFDRRLAAAEKRWDAALAPYRVTSDLMAQAARRAVFMHCLPAHRGDEVTCEVIDGDRSIVFDQAENRLHTAVAVLLALHRRSLDGTDTLPIEGAAR